MDQSFERAVSFLPPALKTALLRTDELLQGRTFEIRLRADRPVVLFGAFGSVLLQRGGGVSAFGLDTALFCTAEQLNDSFHRLCNYSVHAHIRSMTRGFVTTPGGDRVGVAGTAVCDDEGRVVSVRDVTSLNVRVSREKPGCAAALLPLFADPETQGVLLAGAPGAGKTTLLRDPALQLSAFAGGFCQKVAVLDPRQELFGRDGAGGMNCDVFRGYPNALAVPMAVRTMSPQWIVCDEVATAEEARAIETGANTGVRFAASIHAGSKAELLARPLFRFLAERCGFSRVVLLRGAAAPGQVETILKREELFCELDGCSGGAVS